ncbi:Protein fam72a [Linnemannia elongata]|nr:Protein fam72a [Linnemannia elongata]
MQAAAAAATATSGGSSAAVSSSSSQSGPTITAATAQANSSTYANNFPNNISPSLHPQFRAKAVCRLTCKSCLSDVCMRGMKAILLADSRIELYSTDRPPKGVQLVYDDYRTRNCKCRIRDVACLGCGNTLGYHVTQPCESCLEACNNGHFWMFHSDGVSCTERYLPKTSSTAATIAAAAIAAAIGVSSTTSGTVSSSASSGSSSSRSSRRRAGSRRRRRRAAAAQDLSFRRRTSIHDIEYNNAVGAGPSSSSSDPTNGDEDYYNDMDGEDEDYNGFDDEDADSNDEDAEEIEMEEEKPVVMLWAALHAQEERYLQQMQQQLIIQQQQQQQWQQRLHLQQQQQQQQQQQRESEEQAALLNAQGEQRPLHLSVPAISPPTVGSRYHSMISSAISNASMMLWDEGRSMNQYEQLCR